MDIEQLEVMQNYMKQKFLLEDILYVLEKLEDENTYRIHEVSQEMSKSIGNLILSIQRNLKGYKGI
jgi:hypothetical protein